MRVSPIAVVFLNMAVGCPFDAEILMFLDAVKVMLFFLWLLFLVLLPVTVASH